MTTTHAPHHLSEHDPSTHSLLDEPAVLDTFSRDSTPRPRHPTTPLAPDWSFSPEVTDLIESVRHPRGHRRNGSNCSLRTHKRQGSSGSTTSSKGVFADTMPLRPQSRSSTNLNNSPVRPQCGTNLSSSQDSVANHSTGEDSSGNVGSKSSSTEDKKSPTGQMEMDMMLMESPPVTAMKTGSTGSVGQSLMRPRSLISSLQ